MRIAILSVLWLGISVCYWRASVPLAPTQLIEVPGRDGPYFLPSAEEFMTTRRGPPKKEGGYQLGFGPFELRDIHTGRIKRQLFDESVELRTFGAEKRDRAVIEKEGRVLIVRLSDGGTICEVPEAAGANVYRILAAGQVLLVERKRPRSLAAFELETGRRLWGTDQMRCVPYIGDVGPKYVVLASLTPSPAASSLGAEDLRILDARTGEPAPLRDLPAALYRVAGSQDGRWLAVHIPLGSPGKLCTMYDAQSGLPQWSMNRSIAEVASFSEDGNELQIPWQAPDGRIGVARWSASDGRELAPLPDNTQGAIPVISADRRLAVIGKMHWKFPPILFAYAAKYNWQKAAALFAPQHTLTVTNLDDNVVLGVLHPDENGQLVVDDGRGFVTRRHTATAYYTFPPRRDWLWLIKWGVVPPAALLLLARGWSRWRRTRVKLNTRHASGVSRLMSSGPL